MSQDPMSATVGMIGGCIISGWWGKTDVVRYISMGEWFDDGTEAFVIDDYRPGADCALFVGLRHGKRDEEVCPFDDFLFLGHHSE